MNKLFTVILLAVTLIVTACSSDSAEPSEQTINGTWTTEFIHLQVDNGAVCNQASTRTVLHDDNGVISGTQNGSFTCDDGSSITFDNDVITGDIDTGAETGNWPHLRFTHTATFHVNGIEYPGICSYDVNAEDARYPYHKLSSQIGCTGSPDGFSHIGDIRLVK